MKNLSTSLTITIALLASACSVTARQDTESTTQKDGTITIEGVVDNKPIHLVVVQEEIAATTTESRSIIRPRPPQVMQNIDPLLALFGGGGVTAAVATAAYFMKSRRDQTNALERRKREP